MKSLSVLVADDGEDIRSLLAGWLAEAGYTVTDVANATKARKLIKKQKFDLVVTDVLMPDGDGLQLMRELRDAQPSARIVAMSGGGHYMDDNDCLKMARGLGAHAVVKKPFKREQMFLAIEQALGPEASAEA